MAPRYCQQSLADLLDFAPKHATITSIPALHDGSKPRCHTVLPHPTLNQVWCSHGLVPAQLLFATDQTERIATPIPFTSTGWCARFLTTKETARCFDLPVPAEKRLSKAYFVLPSNQHIRQSVPCKIISHSLWLCGLLNCSDGGIDGGEKFFPPVYKLDSVSGHLVSQKQFNLASTTTDSKAVKTDDALVPVHLWDSRLIKTYPTRALQHIEQSQIHWALNIFRKHAFGRWCKSTFRSFIRYLKQQWPAHFISITNKDTIFKFTSLPKELQKDLEAGLEAITYATKASFWEWNCGSRLFFWRWTPEFKLMARDGIPVCWLPEIKPKTESLNQKYMIER